MRIRPDLTNKPYYRCLVCPNFRTECGGRPTRDKNLKEWCEYIRDVMDTFPELTIAYVAEKAEVSQKRIEMIRALRDDQDIMRATARRIEQVVLGKATNHICDMDFDKTTSQTIADLQAKIERLEKENTRYAKIIDKYLD